MAQHIHKEIDIGQFPKLEAVYVAATKGGYTDIVVQGWNLWGKAPGSRKRSEIPKSIADVGNQNAKIGSDTDYSSETNRLIRLTVQATDGMYLDPGLIVDGYYQGEVSFRGVFPHLEYEAKLVKIRQHEVIQEAVEAGIIGDIGRYGYTNRADAAERWVLTGKSRKRKTS